MSTSPSQTNRPRPKRRWRQFSLSTLFLVMAAAAVVAWFVSPERKAANYVERDLALELTVLGDGTVRWAQDDGFELALVNRSTGLSHLVLEHQLRFIYCEAKYRTQSGEWADVPSWRSTNSGVVVGGGFDTDYYTEHNLAEIPHVVMPGDAVPVHPGERIPTRLPGPSGWDVPTFPAKVRIRFHCVYHADKLEVQLPMTIASDGRLTYQPNGSEPLIIAMQEVPSFHLVSPWVEFTLVGPGGR